MLDPSVRALIVAEQARQHDRFIEGVDLGAYLDKIGSRAEILTVSGEGRCRGVVAYYCNDISTQRGFITLVLVSPLDRGAGIGKSLVSCSLAHMKSLGLTACRLEVADHSPEARALYDSLGFRTIEARTGRVIMEVTL